MPRAYVHLHVCPSYYLSIVNFHGTLQRGNVINYLATRREGFNLPQRSKTAGSNPCRGKNFLFVSMSLAGSDIRSAMHPTATESSSPGREAPGP